MNQSPKHLIKLLEKNDFVLKRSKGSHQLYDNPNTNKTVIVPLHVGKDMKKGTFMAIIKQAGLDKNDLA